MRGELSPGVAALHSGYGLRVERRFCAHFAVKTHSTFNGRGTKCLRLPRSVRTFLTAWGSSSNGTICAPGSVWRTAQVTAFRDSFPRADRSRRQIGSDQLHHLRHFGERREADHRRRARAPRSFHVAVTPPLPGGASL